MWNFEEDKEILLERIERYSRNIFQAPEEHINYEQRARTYKDLKEYKKSYQDYTKVIELLSPREVGSISSIFYDRGSVSYFLEDWKGAISDYSKAIEINPKYSEAYNNRCSVYYKIKEYDKAFEDVNKALEMDPDNVYALNNRGNLYCIKRDFKQAIIDCTSSIRLGEENPFGYNNRAFAYCQIGEFEAAIKDCQKSIKIDPQSNSNAHLGNAYRGLKMFDKAFKKLNETIEFLPKYPKVYYYRGLTYYDVGKYHEAMKDFDKALDLDPMFRDAFLSKELTQGKLDLFERIEILRKMESFSFMAERRRRRTEKVVQSHIKLRLVGNIVGLADFSILRILFLS